MAGEIPKSNMGFAGFTPYAEVGSPMVPFDQDAYVTVESNHAFSYRGVAQGKHWRAGHIPRGTLQCFMHHGVGYAQDLWPTLKVRGKISLLHTTIGAFAEMLREPYHHVDRGVLPPDFWARLYHRLRFGGIQLKGALETNRFMDRLVVNDLEKCMQ